MVILYLTDSYVQNVTTRIEDVCIIKKKIAISLEKNIFYPGGGGQPSDEGFISFSKSQTIPISKIIKMHGKIFLLLPNEQMISSGESVRAIINWDRRYAYMRCHTAAHVLMGAIKRNVKNYSPAGIDISEAGNTVLVKFKGDWSKDEGCAKYIIDVANEIISKDREVIAKTYSTILEAISEYGDIYRGPIEVSGEVRIVIVANWDANPCGGTHVKYLGEIGEIMLLNCSDESIVFYLKVKQV